MTQPQGPTQIEPGGSVATPQTANMVRGCGRDGCDKPIQRPRRGQRFCSSVCRMREWDRTHPRLRQMQLFRPNPAAPLPLPPFDGDSYDAALDGARLSKLAAAVRLLVADGAWRTPAEFEQALGRRWASISARLRDLRKLRHGGHHVEQRRVGEAEAGTFAYRWRPRGEGCSEWCPVTCRGLH